MGFYLLDIAAQKHEIECFFAASGQQSNEHRIVSIFLPFCWLYIQRVFVNIVD